MKRGSLLLLAAALSAGGCGRPSAASGPSVVLISIDTLRADHLPAYGYRHVATPGLDALRRDSILYEKAYAHAPLTLPSHASLLTGLLPYENGVRDNVGFRLSSSHPTLALLLKTRGYATGAAVSSFALRRDRGLGAGFDFYDDEFPPGSSDERPGTQTAERLERWIETATKASASRPIFAFLHLYEPHTPYAPPEPFRTRYAGNPYDGEIAAADDVVARFLEFLKKRRLYDAALIVFLSDHGEGLNDHGEDEHGVFLYRETIRVPLLLKLPQSRRAGETVRGPVGLIDVFPTVAQLAGIDGSAKTSGISLVRGASRAGENSRTIYSETLYPRLQLGWSDLASLTDRRYQYIEAPRPELYDVIADPGERADLAASKPPAFRSLRLALENLRRPTSAPEKSTPEELEKLGSLGYVSVNAGGSGKNLPDPKDRIAALKKYKALFALFYARRDREAVTLAREILSENPGILSVSRMMSASLERLGKSGEAAQVLEGMLARENPGGTPEDLAQAYEQLATLLEGSGDRAGAERTLRESIRRGVATPEIEKHLAKNLLGQGRSAEALALLPAAGSADSETLDLNGAALAEAGRNEGARRCFLQALEIDATYAPALFHMGMLSLRERDPSAARGWFEKSLSANPRAPATLAGLGLAQAALGDEKAAFDSWSRALALDPNQYDALFNRAVLAGRMGRPEQARRELERFVAIAPPSVYAEKIAQARRLLKSLRSRS